MKEFFIKINFFVASLVSILGFTLIYEVITEHDFDDKIDDILMLILGIISIWWYRKSGSKGTSATPALWISGLAVVIKIMAIVIEHADKEAIGDDIGIFISLLLAFILIAWQVFSHKKRSK